MGWCYIAYCNGTCNVVKESKPCGSTPSPTTISSTTVVRTTVSPTTTVYTTYSSSISASTTTPATTTFEPDCNTLVPPRKNGESWQMNSCTNATCENGKVVYTSVQCKPIVKPNCENGRNPVEIFEENGCCSTYECECSCNGWGGSHYVTFDGQDYDIRENCSYVLVQEITPNYNNFKVVIDYHDCGSGSSFCPQSLTIYYKSYEVVLTQTLTANGVLNMVIVNQKRVYPAFKNGDFIITSTGLETVLAIPLIEAQVTYTGSSFGIDLPFSLFKNNTEGQCGTCDNSKENDCRSPDGQVTACSVTAHSWLVPGETCEITPTPIPTLPPKTTAPVCKPSICEIINSVIFEACRKVVPSGAYVEGCKSDVCTKTTSGCASLQGYASACAQAGVCVDWRDSTNGECAYKCPATKVYTACGPSVEPTCNSNYNIKYMDLISSNSTDMKEGCSCPVGTTLFSTYSDVCVTSCECTGPDGNPKKVNETWQTDCKQCTCEPDTLSVQCEPVSCPPPITVTCDQPGYEIVNKTDGCCQSQTCVPKAVCVRDNKEYQPGAAVPTNNSCESCTCGSTVDPNTQLHAVKCYPLLCFVNCPETHVYQPVPGECCGTCVPSSCVVKLPDNTTHSIPVNETWSPTYDKCITYKCENHDGSLEAVKSTKVCPSFNPDNCVPGTETTDADGCCKTCTLRSTCNVQTNSTKLTYLGCTTSENVELTSCAGSCGTSSIYSAQANGLVHSCSCCQEETTQKKVVELICPDGKRVLYSYIYIESCACNATDCGGKSTSSSKLRRRRR
ncbi:intestinal mucin-like protein [Alosa alosa]|nr:intestinal mucin-like protein [Alosa alosa]